MRSRTILLMLLLVVSAGALVWERFLKPRPPAPVELGVSHPDFLAHGRKFYSQGREELIIRHFFQDRREGFFLDVGCAHYRKISTTYFLEKHLGWSGVAVDALAEYAEGYRLHRPRTRFANFLVGDKSGPGGTIFRISHPNRDEQIRFLSTVSAARREQVRREICADCTYREYELEAITLNDLLERYGVNHIDFLSMDIEDAEPAALAGFDIRRYKPELVCIEAHESVSRDVLDYFDRHDYARIDRYLPYDEMNWYFKPRS